MRKKAPEPEFLLTAARGRKTGDDCGPAGGFDIPCIQAAVGIPLCARAKCRQGMRAGEKQREQKNLHRRAQTFTEGMNEGHRGQSTRNMYVWARRENNRAKDASGRENQEECK